MKKTPDHFGWKLWVFSAIQLFEYDLNITWSWGRVNLTVSLCINDTIKWVSMAKSSVEIKQWPQDTSRVSVVSMRWFWALCVASGVSASFQKILSFRGFEFLQKERKSLFLYFYWQVPPSTFESYIFSLINQSPPPAIDEMYKTHTKKILCSLKMA